MSVIVSLHDVHPSTFDESRRLLRLVEDRGIEVTLLVVPGRWNGASLDDDRGVVGWLHEAADRGHEIAMHGWTHRVEDDRTRARRNPRNRLAARGCAEFVDLDADAARVRLEAGLAALARHGLHPVGFTPPGWLASPGTLGALRDLDFAYSTSHGSVVDLGRGHRHRIPALCQRPDSPVTTVGCSIVRRLLVHRVVHRRHVRLALHPADCRDPRLLAATTQLLDIAACAPTATYAELVDIERTAVA